MAEKILNGYLISEYDYKDFDKILTFLTEEKIISCIGMGLKKINSKNSRNLFIGHLTEIQFFEARLEKKLSRLKKVYLLEALSKDLIENKTLIFLNKVFEKIETEKSHVNLLKIYEKFLELIKSQKYPDLFLVNYLLIKCQIIFGFKLNYQKCSTCGSTQRIYSVSKDDYGILCYLCSQLAQNPSWTKEAILLFLYLNRDELEKALEYQTGSRLLFAFMQEVYLKLVGVKFSYYE